MYRTALLDLSDAARRGEKQGTSRLKKSFTVNSSLTDTDFFEGIVADGLHYGA